jgi:glycosyltransferase involved in cell wall biosynthesis
VLVFTGLFPTPSDPANGIFKWQLVHALASICEVTVVCPLPWFPRWTFLRRFARWYRFAEVPREYEVGGIRVVSPKYPMLPRVSERLHAVVMFLASLATVWRLHRRMRFDIMNPMWLYPDAVAAGWIGRLLRIRMVPTGSGCDVNRMLDEGDKRGQILAMLRRSSVITVVSEALRQNVVARGIPAERVSTTPNGVNTELFQVRDRAQARSELALPAAAHLLLYVGRLSEEKGLATLLEAVARLRGKRDGFLLYLVGEGPQLGELRERALSLGLEQTVRFAGPQDHAAVAKWLAACDVLCLPSLREGCPNVVLEALSSGRPVVASRVGGVPEFVREGNGLLVRPQDPEALSAALADALARDWNAQAIAQSVSGCSWGAAAERYHLAYCEALSAAAGGQRASA